MRLILVCFLATVPSAMLGAADNPDAGIGEIIAGHTVSEPVSLIPDKGLDGWTAHWGKPLTKTRWKNTDGKLELLPPGKDYDHTNGDIVTVKEYKNFILDFDWIASKGCNSGVKIRLKDFGEIGAKINYSKTFGWLGIEYQILDDFNNGEGKKGDGRWSSAALYSMFAPDKNTKHLQPHGKVNSGRIVVLDNHIEHWLNGEKVLQYDIGSEVWSQALKNGKFARAKGFGENSDGFIMLQDHGHAVTITKLLIREVKKK